MSTADANGASAGIRLHLAHFADGWGWRAWEECVEGRWCALRTPALHHQRRRFQTRQDAERFFHFLAAFMLATPTEYVSARRVVRRRL